MARSLRLVPALLALSLLASGCAVVQAQSEAAEQDSTAALPPSRRLLEVVEWADLDGLVSVVVRNNTTRVLTAAEAVVTLRDDHGAVVRPEPGAGCCVEAPVPPGATYAFQVDARQEPGTDLGDDLGAAVIEVDVDFRTVSWAVAGPSDDPQVMLQPAVLTADPVGAVVATQAQSVGGSVASAVVQARLQDAQGALVAVVTTTATCLEPSSPQALWLQLTEPVPAGTTVGYVVALPQPSAAPCPAPAV